MFVNRTSGSALRGGGAAIDENAAILHSKTPTATKTPKRRAFGDISNRKNTTTAAGKNTLQVKKTPHVSIVPKSSKTTTRRSKVTFALPNKTPAVHTTKKLAPVKDVELSAGRTWSEQLLLEKEDDDVGVQEILQEQALWQNEVDAFIEEERTRHVRIREQQNAMAEKELQEKMEALWKRDEKGTSI